MPTNDHLWDEEEVARYLNVSVHAVRKWKTKKILPKIKLGQLTRYDPEEIRQFALRGRKPAHCPNCDTHLESREPDLPWEATLVPRYFSDQKVS